MQALGLTLERNMKIQEDPESSPRDFWRTMKACRRCAWLILLWADSSHAWTENDDGGARCKESNSSVMQRNGSACGYLRIRRRRVMNAEQDREEEPRLKLLHLDAEYVNGLGKTAGQQRSSQRRRRRLAGQAVLGQGCGSKRWGRRRPQPATAT